MMRFSTTPVAGPPICPCAFDSAARMSAVVVSVKSVSIVGVLSRPSRRRTAGVALPAPCSRRRAAGAVRLALQPELQPPPGPAVPGDEVVGAFWARRPGRVLLWLVVVGPELLDRVEDL